MREPQTDEEWQNAANGAEWALAVDSARLYGLITGGPIVDVERCEELLTGARARGIQAELHAVEAFTKAWQDAFT